jgi:hypothetical protein
VDVLFNPLQLIALSLCALILQNPSCGNHLTWRPSGATLAFNDYAIFNELTTPHTTWFLA